jgi:hypothetical protein
MALVILIAILVILLGAGALFVYGGFKRSVNRGIRNVVVLLFTTIIAVIAARFVSKDYASLPLSGSVLATIRETLTANGMYSAEMETVLNATAERITYTVLIAVFFIILFTIASVTLTIIDHVNKKYRITAFRHRNLITAVCSVLSGGYLVVFALFAPPVNIAAEAANIENTVQTVSAITSGEFGTAIEKIDLITDAIMNTDFIAADKTERFNLVQSAIVAGAARQSDPMVASLLSNLTFDSPEEMQAEMKKTSELVAMAADSGIDLNDIGSATFSVVQLTLLKDADAFAAKVYSMKNYESLVRTILTTGVREFTNDDTFEYPADVKIAPDTQDDFVVAIRLVPEMVTTSKSYNSENRNAENTAKMMEEMNTLRGLGFVTPAIYQKFADYLGITV